ncbi:MAG: hypothetical protein RIR65_1454 [Planctomycetota bacterium]
MSDSATTVQPKRKWGFLSASLVALVVISMAQVAGSQLETFGDTGFGARELVLLGFLGSVAGFLWIQREAVKGYFRSMKTGVSLIALSILAIAAGVLVPQIDGFEDPEERVPVVSDIPRETLRGWLDVDHTDLAPLAGLSAEQRQRAVRWREHYRAFRWAEGYFVYHLLHPYGIGLPESQLPAPALAGLDRFESRYGKEERDNRQKSMTAAFSGREKSAEIGRLVREHEDAFLRAFEVSTFLHLNRTYKSHWFAMLLALVGAGMMFNTFTGAPRTWFTWRRSGFIVVHLGVLTFLVGGALSKWKTDRGIMHLLLESPPQQGYWGHFSPDKPREMPFALTLERFARRDWKTMQVVFNGDDFKSNPPEFTLWPGRKVVLDRQAGADGVERARIEVEVLELAERAEVDRPRFWESDEPGHKENLGAIAALGLVGGQQSFLKPDVPGRQTLYDPRWNWRLMVVEGGDAREAKKRLSSPDEDRLGWLSLKVAAQGDVQSTRHAIRLGDSIDAGDYQVVVREAMADFRLDEGGKTEVRDPRPIHTISPRNPGVWLEITPTRGGHTERRLVLEALNAEEHDLQKRFEYAELVASLEWDRWNSRGPTRAVLHYARGAEPTLHFDDGREVPAKSGSTVDMPGDGDLVVGDLVHEARLEKVVRFDPEAEHIDDPEFSPYFYSADPTGAKLKVTIDKGTDKERVELVTMASTDQSLANLWIAPDESFYIRYYENDAGFPFEWRSVLAVHEHECKLPAWRKFLASFTSGFAARGDHLDAGCRLDQLARIDAGDEREREIRVNDYFHWKGYRFFQTNADPRNPRYSGIGVVYDPGIPIVLLGMYLTIFGAVIVFIMRPIMAARREDRASGRSESRPGEES